MGFTALLCLVTSILSFADMTTSEQNGRPDRLIRQEGQIISLRISRDEPLRIFVLGKEEAQVNLDEVSLRVRRLKPYPGKTLKLSRFGQYFEVENSTRSDRITELEVSAGFRGQNELFRIDLREAK